LARRNLVNEHWLVRTIFELRNMRQRVCSPARLNILQERLVKELVEFICPTKDEAKDPELGGRESGSLAWRLARQEIRAADSGVGSSAAVFVWKITRDLALKQNNCLELFYDSVQDEYILGRSKESYRRGWNGGLFELENISRKEEKDWRMVYLARNGWDTLPHLYLIILFNVPSLITAFLHTENQGDKPGKLSWKFELAEAGISMYSILLKIPCATFHSSASISVELLTSTGKRLTLPGESHRS